MLREIESARRQVRAWYDRIMIVDGVQCRSNIIFVVRGVAQPCADTLQFASVPTDFPVLELFVQLVVNDLSSVCF